MIEVGFALILGFSIISTFGGLIEDGSRWDRILLRGLVYLAALATIISLVNTETGSFLKQLVSLTMLSLTKNVIWFLLGAGLALIIQLISEGLALDLWIRIHPQSAPTPEARAGERAQVAGFTKKTMPATLVGTSTQFLNEDLDLRTDTLVRLCYFAFEDRSAFTLSQLESSLRLGTGRRQKAYHKLVVGLRGRPAPKKTAHRYWRSVNGSARLSQGLFADLCRLARETGNRDKDTVQRLSKVASVLGLAPNEACKFI